MDSMRSLNTSLPSARRRPQPPAQLLQAFKTAALQVTNLYKAAATDREQAHDEGYLAALEDMLSFLDAENLGVGDGEGWRVRQWVTEKLQESMAAGSNGMDSDDDKDAGAGANEDAASRARSSSPVLSRRPPPSAGPTDDSSATTTTPSVVPSTTAAAVPSEQQTTVVSERPAAVFDTTSLPKSDFTFRASAQLPDLDMDADDQQQQQQLADNNNNFNVFPRHHNTRSSSNRARHHHHQNAASAAAVAAAAAAQIGNLGQGAGFKRRAPLGDFFDIAGLGNGKDGFGGGGKRGRFT